MERFVRVYACLTEAEAGLVEFRLNGAGIEVQLRGGSRAGLGGEIPFEETRVEILVPESAADRALTILHEKTDSTAGPEVSCPHCGETNDGDFAICWHCQRPLDGSENPEGAPVPYERSPASNKTNHQERTMIRVVLFFLSLAVVGLAIHSYRLSKNQMTDDALFSYDWNETGDCLRTTWRSTGSLRFLDCDADGNEIFEKSTQYYYDGKVMCESRDANENGINESQECFNPGGEKTSTFNDRDEDGFAEEETIFYGKSGRVVIRDENRDHRHEIREHFDGAGNLIGRFTDDGPAGLRGR